MKTTLILIEFSQSDIYEDNFNFDRKLAILTSINNFDMVRNGAKLPSIKTTLMLTGIQPI